MNVTRVTRLAIIFASVVLLTIDSTHVTSSSMSLHLHISLFGCLDFGVPCPVSYQVSSVELNTSYKFYLSLLRKDCGVGLPRWPKQQLQFLLHAIQCYHFYLLLKQLRYHILLLYYLAPAMSTVPTVL